MANRFTYRKYQGDDSLSYAVFDGRTPIMTGLSRSGAQHECQLRNPQVDRYAPTWRRVGIRIGLPIYVIEQRSGEGTYSYWPMTIGYAIGKRNDWTVYDGRSYRNRQVKDIVRTFPDLTIWGKKIGEGVSTLREAAALAVADRETRANESNTKKEN